MCREAQIKPEDVKVKNIEEFKAKIKAETGLSVAEISENNRSH